MIGKKLEEALNGQVNAELYSAYLYLSMESYFKSLNLNGFANWMRVQTQEEIVHAMKMYDFINERKGRAILKVIEGPPTEWDSPRAVFEAAYTHEQKVTGLINGLVDLAIKEKDHATSTFLQWFVNEQVEEESSADQIVQQLKMMENAPGGLFMLDRELALRVFIPPPAQGQGQP
jgi:ferritin